MNRDSLPQTGRRSAGLVASALGALLLLAAATAAGAGLPPLRWLCWENVADDSLRCLLDPAVRARRSARGADAAEAAETSRLARRLPPKLPPVARRLRLEPHAFAGHEVAIPLLGPVEGGESLHELAQSVMCGSRPNCTVVFSPSPLSIRLLELIDDDPAL